MPYNNENRTIFCNLRCLFVDCVCPIVESLPYLIVKVKLLLDREQQII